MLSCLNATRNAQQPLSQPAYSFASVPPAQRDLSESTVQYVTDRRHLQQSMAEMLLLCKQAIRRRQSSSVKTAWNKPLSLEYLADRLDVDDPCFGYLIRSKGSPKEGSQEGMLQGFITVTCFTTWQQSLEWDSRHPMAFDDPDHDGKNTSDATKFLRDDGTLSDEIQQTVHAGDIHGEGIVWPRIAEISLLGGLGCGKALVSLAIEHLERAKPTATANYDYVVLQATENSIPFYQTMGFVRVGAVMRGDPASTSSNDETSSSEEEVQAVPLPKDSPEKATLAAVPDGVITSAIRPYTVKRAGETPNEVAKKLRLDVWDIIFLNKRVYEEIAPSSRLLAGTVLSVPVKQTLKPPSKRNVVQPEYYVAKENDTPRTIARMFNVSCLDLVEANKARHPGLLSGSRLRNGTRIQVSHLHEAQLLSDTKPYSHWTFPDDDFEDGEPSYMMVRKLQRCKGAAARQTPFASSLATRVAPYHPPPESLFLPPPAMTAPDNKSSLFNKVVKLLPGAVTEGITEYTYWYVLTYIPDLQWCHLAPLQKVGTFVGRSEGRPKYKLVDESLGKEVDLSSRFCIPIRSKSIKRTLDADKEEWDLYDDGSDPCESDKDLTRKRKRMHDDDSAEQRLVAVLPGLHGDELVKVRLVGSAAAAAVSDSHHRPARKRGRPLGSKTKLVRDASSSSSGSSTVSEAPSALRAFPVKSGMKRPRGRPKGSTTKKTVLVSQSSTVGKRPRGRPKGSTKKKLLEDRVTVQSPPTKQPRLRFSSPTVSDESPKSAIRAGARPSRMSAPLFLGESPASPRRPRGRPKGSKNGKTLSSAALASPLRRPLRRSCAPQGSGPLVESPVNNLPPFQSRPSRVSRKSVGFPGCQNVIAT